MSLPTEMITKYGNLLDEIGHGYHGKVYRSASNFAVKVFPTHFNYVFEREISVMKSCTNNYIIECLDSYTTHDYNFIVMPLGVPIKTISVSLFRDVSLGLKYLHQQGFLHLDIKPANMLNLAGRGVLIDFGFTKLPEDLTCIERYATLMYKAPELFNLKIRPSVDSDIWALGISILDIAVGGMKWLKILRKAEFYFRLRERFETSHYIQQHIRDLKLRDLLVKILKWEPKERLTLDQILAHPYFN